MEDRSNRYVYRVFVVIEREDSINMEFSEEAFHPLDEFDTLEEAQEFFDGIVEREG